MVGDAATAMALDVAASLNSIAYAVMRLTDAEYSYR